MKPDDKLTVVLSVEYDGKLKKATYDGLRSEGRGAQTRPQVSRELDARIIQPRVGDRPRAADVFVHAARMLDIEISNHRFRNVNRNAARADRRQARIRRGGTLARCRDRGRDSPRPEGG